MPKDMPDHIGPPQLSDSLRMSIEHYSSMLVLLEKIAAQISNDEESVKALLHELKCMQSQIEKVDADLNLQLQRFQESSPDSLAELSLHPMFEKRLKLMDEVRRMNGLLLPKISGIMSLISHEIGELKGGRNAISGYRAQGDGTASKRHYTA